MTPDSPAGSPWHQPDCVAGFRRSPPNETLLTFAAGERLRAPGGILLDIGCGAARNAVPLAEQGWAVVGVDMSWPMLHAAVERARQEHVAHRSCFVMSSMDRLPAAPRTFDVIVAHGIWNLATSTREFRAAVAEAGRVARPDAGLFVFTFSRSTLADDARPVPGERFVFTQFSGRPQCFLTSEQLIAELDAAGFVLDPAVPLIEHNLPRPGALPTGRVPVIFEAAFRKVRSPASQEP